MIKAKIVSSLEKPFENSDIESYKSLKSISILKNERLSFQVFYTHGDSETVVPTLRPKIFLEGPLAKYATIRDAVAVPSRFPYTPKHDEGFTYLTPTACPDVLMPISGVGMVFVEYNKLKGLWIEIDLRKEDNISSELSGELKISFIDTNGNAVWGDSLNIEVIDASLPKQALKYTDWFHCDSLANYYKCDAWSEKHWNIIESFLKTAVSNGMNVVLTPLFTVALDTEVGNERLTTQLLKIEKKGEGYSFDFSLVDRWVDMCNRVGIENFEVCHLFTQWGCAHAPKVMATVDGEYKRIFGWETSATDPEYIAFLRAMLTEFIAHMKKRGDDKRCYFHISDEPNSKHLENYKAARAAIEDVLEGYIITDACSHIEYYNDGIISAPVPSNDKVMPFYEAGVPNLWTYYCCSQWDKVSNRFMAMPSSRNRSIGYQLFKYDIAGFLHWGYNFYNSWLSKHPINPYFETAGYGAYPDGDAFSVYPAPDGTAYESLRIVVFYEALQDMRAASLCASLCGKDRTLAALEEILGEIRFDNCALTAEPLLLARERINSMIKETVKK